MRLPNSQVMFVCAGERERRRPVDVRTPSAAAASDVRRVQRLPRQATSCLFIRPYLLYYLLRVLVVFG